MILLVLLLVRAKTVGSSVGLRGFILFNIIIGQAFEVLPLFLYVLWQSWEPLREEFSALLIPVEAMLILFGDLLLRGAAETEVCALSIGD